MLYKLIHTLWHDLHRSSARGKPIKKHFQKSRLREKYTLIFMINESVNGNVLQNIAKKNIIMQKYIHYICMYICMSVNENFWGICMVNTYLFLFTQKGKRIIEPTNRSNAGCKSNLSYICKCM